MPDFYLDGVAVAATPGETVLAACLRLGVKLQTVCKGKGMCGACRVLVEEQDSAMLPPPSANETRLLTYLDKQLGGGGDARNHRLACQIIHDEAFAGLRLSALPLTRKPQQETVK